MTMRPLRTHPSFSVMFVLSLVLALPATTARGQKKDFPSIADVTKDYQAVRGEDGSFMTLYVNRKAHRILGEVPGSLQKRPFLLAPSITGGPRAGWQMADLMVYWERHDRKLVLVEPEIRYKAGGGTIKDVVKRTYRDQIITAVPIMALGPSGAVLIDLTALFAGRASLFVGSLATGTDASLAKISQAKVFPKNVELEFDLPRVRSRGYFSYSYSRGSGSSGGIAVHYSISQLPSTGYKVRLADDRIGYFVTAHKDFSRSPREETTFVRYINRWHLEKADTSLELSPPKKQIKFYVEKTVPIRYRQYVFEGILEWNKAFEKVGILGAIAVEQQMETGLTAKLDPEDVRYNFFRWITSERAFAMGPSRVHPETGQILDADIIFDESMVRDWLEEYESMIRKGPVKDFHPALKRYLKENPGRHPMRRWMSPSGSAGEIAEEGPNEGEPLARPGIRREGDLLEDHDAIPGVGLKSGTLCDYGHGKRHQFNFGLTVLRVVFQRMQGDSAKAGKNWPEEFVGQVIKETVMHEVGHTLGLRHNFKASSWLSLDEINRAENTPEAISGSVMDYNPTNISPRGEPQGRWNTTTLGPYDYWAIEYGYTLKNDPKELAKIPSRVAEKGLAYATDEDTYSSDPYVYRFDMGSDPMDYARRRMELVDQTMRNLVGRVVEAGQGYQRVRQVFDMLLYEHARACWMAARFVGGHHLRRDHKGDPNERLPVEPVAAAKQREALDLICDSMFKRDVFRFPPGLLNRLAVGRWYHWGSNDDVADSEYPIHDRILQLQLWSIFDFLNPRTLTLIADAELRTERDKDALTIPELFEKLNRSIWTEVTSVPQGEYTNRKPLIDSFRRNLQHEYVGELINIALEGDYGRSPQSARTQAWFRLRELGDSIGKLLEGAKKKADLQLDDYSRAHLEETRQRIAKALEASYSRGDTGGGGGVFYLFGKTGPEK